MKKIMNGIFGIGLVLLAGCGEERSVYQVGGDEGAAEAKVAPAVKPAPVVNNPAPVPEALIVNATVKDADIFPVGSQVTLKLKLSAISYEDSNFNEKLNLKNASVTFGSKHDKCQFQGGFGAIAPGETITYKLRGSTFSDCPALFGNIRRSKDMHIRFENVPLANDPNEVIPFVELRLAPPA